MWCVLKNLPIGLNLIGVEIGISIQDEPQSILIRVQSQIVPGVMPRYRAC